MRAEERETCCTALVSVSGLTECSGVLGEMPGSFVPTVTAITTSQDLQWLRWPLNSRSSCPIAPLCSGSAPEDTGGNGELGGLGGHSSSVELPLGHQQ
ncbi:ABC transporter ATP-binding protein [Platysternon megacephalum]|uniref:ABC transporter ATP-binding protein n=1 Tax=Platysternon megacephalum TaxID=55544 RepID=A0A4D9DCJ5_9SAUR|nr:ABC transporter ATP-binding protein [Platysternon megacephalum]